MIRKLFQFLSVAAIFFALCGLSIANETDDLIVKQFENVDLKAEVENTCRSGPRRKASFGRSAAYMIAKIGWEKIGENNGKEAIIYFLTAINTGPKGSGSYLGLAIGSHLHDLALPIVKMCFETAIREVQDKQNAKINFGRALSERKEHEEAIEVFQQVLINDPSNALVLAGIAYNYDMLGEKQNAEVYLKKSEEAQEAKQN
jgi:tetratricopeptide (TPR) repeat protein